MSEITYTGYTAIPSDYECADGQLALSLNAIQENGSMQPIFPPTIIFTLPTGYKVAYIHKTSNFEHYIITAINNNTDKGIYWINKTDATGNRTDLNEKKQPDDTDSDTYYHLLDSPDGDTIQIIQAVGNTLIIITNTAMNYYLWKTTEENQSFYQYLGTHLPELTLSFGLQGEIVRDVDDLDDETIHDQTITSDGYTVYYGFEIKLEEEINEDCDWNDFKETGRYEISDDNKTIINERTLAQVNKFIADHATNKGKFLYPFFVRYAYRLYDGTLTMHSAPILMLANTVCSPVVFIEGYNIHGTRTSFISEWQKGVSELYCSVSGVVHTLDYAATNTQEELDNIAQTWGDIIKSVDIFISAPLYNYDQSGEVRYLQYAPQASAYDDTYGYSLCRPSIVADRHYNTWTDHPQQSTAYTWEGQETKTITENGAEKEELYYCLYNYCHCPFNFLRAVTDGCPSFRVELPTKGEETIADEAKDCCNFYFLKSIKTEEIKRDATIIDIPDDHLQSLVNREQMTDDYDSHDELLPTFAYNYNARFVIANITKNLYAGYNPMAIFCYINGALQANDTALTFYSEESRVYATIYTYIKEDNKTIIVQSPISHLDLVWLKTGAGEESLRNDHIYFFYPNTNAYKAQLVRFGDDDTDVTVIQEMTLEPHDFLNGAVYFDNWEEPPVTSTTKSDIPQPTTDQTVPVANKIYNSEVNDPFFFPVENIVTVGTGTIVGIATAAKALSQGQFGEFPLYAFCDDGVWALSVASTGVYAAVQPITRDVCINSNAITQLDQTVLFPTDRGIMQISGADTQCFTDTINGNNNLDITTLPRYTELLTIANLQDTNLLTIKDILTTCNIIYDYPNQRVYITNDNSNMAFVISSISNSWGMATIDILSTVNSYPYALANDTKGHFVDISHPDNSQPQNCLIITRPLKLDGPNVLKTASAVIHRGFFRTGHVQTVLYGTRDLFNYHLLRSSATREIRTFSGTGYKAFIVATIAQLDSDESIFGVTINAKARFTRKER